MTQMPRPCHLMWIICAFLRFRNFSWNFRTRWGSRMSRMSG